jgi:hypothetical protein
MWTLTEAYAQGPWLVPNKYGPHLIAYYNREFTSAVPASLSITNQKLLPSTTQIPLPYLPV